MAAVDFGEIITLGRLANGAVIVFNREKLEILVLRYSLIAAKPVASAT
jgi:hypothetical protein